MKSFEEFLKSLQEQVATGSSVGNNNIINNNDDDGDNDDDENWQWDKLQRFDAALVDWAHNDPLAKRINNRLFEMIFQTTPQAEVKEYYGDDENEHEFSPTGELMLSVQWKMPVDSIEDSLFNTLRNSTLWRPLQIQPNQLWNTLDKGDLFDYVFYHIKSAMLGQSVNISNQYYHPEKPDGQRFDNEYFPQQKAWQKDKQTFEKYTKFVLYQKQEELKQKAAEYLPFEANLQKTRESVRALVWEDNFDASAYIWYRYQKTD